MDNNLIPEQSRPFDLGKVKKEIKLEYKDFPPEKGLHCLFLENYKWIEDAPFKIEKVPEDTDKFTKEKKNYFCLDVSQIPLPAGKRQVQPISDVMRGFVVKEARQSVFFSATKNSGYLFVSKEEGAQHQYLRPFLCGSIIKKKIDLPEGEDPKSNDDGMTKLLKTKGKIPMEIFLSLKEAPKQVRSKEEAETYQDNDMKEMKQELKKIKQKKKQNLEDYEEGIGSDQDELDELKREKEDDNES